MCQSIWLDSIQLPQFNSLQGECRTEVLIIGGGMCGILCAKLLQDAGVDYMLVEADVIGNGITKNTTAKITAQHGCVYDRMIRNEGKEVASRYLWANMRALEKYRELVKGIDCDFEEKDAFVYSRFDKEKIEREVEAVESLGFPASFSEKLPLPIEVEGAICFPNQAQFHPLKFIAGIARDLNIYEHTKVEALAPYTAWIENGKIRARYIIVATHFPFLNKHGSYFLKLYQHRSYVIALENATLIEGMYLDEEQTGMSFRRYKDLLLIGGGSHRTGKQGGNWQELREFASQTYPKAKERYAWATQDCMSLDGIPYIGQYSRNTPDFYVASGFNKWGMTSSMVAAMLLCGQITGNVDARGEIFSPSRSIWRPQLFLNGVEAVKNLLTPTTKRCPHLGCALKWNPQEHSRDCPCHGSRFREDGILIDNPATGNAHID